MSIKFLTSRRWARLYLVFASGALPMCRVEVKPASVGEVLSARAVEVVRGELPGASSPLVVEVGGARLGLDSVLLVVEAGGFRRARFNPGDGLRAAAVVETDCFDAVVAELVKAIKRAGLLDHYRVDVLALERLGVRLAARLDPERAEEAARRLVYGEAGHLYTARAPRLGRAAAVAVDVGVLERVASALREAGLLHPREVASIAVALDGLPSARLERLASAPGVVVEVLKKFGVGELYALAEKAAEVRRCL